MSIKKAYIDVRILGAAIRYSLPKETGLMPICVSELKITARNFPTWLLETIKQEAEQHIELEYAKGTFINTDYARKIIAICEEEIARPKVVHMCKYGHEDCVLDPGYIKFHHEKWYKDLGEPKDCPDCYDGDLFDDEDK